MDNGLAGQQSIEQTDEKPWWFRRGRLLHSVDWASCHARIVADTVYPCLEFSAGNGLDGGWIHLTLPGTLLRIISGRSAGVSGERRNSVGADLAAGFYHRSRRAVAVFVNGILMLILTVLVHQYGAICKQRRGGLVHPASIQSRHHFDDAGLTAAGI